MAAAYHATMVLWFRLLAVLFSPLTWVGVYDPFLWAAPARTYHDKRFRDL